MDLHPLIQGFADVAEAYERGRPGYPATAIAAIGLPAGARVVDVGAGTGKLTRALRDAGLDVVAVEPVDGMRARLAAGLPEVEALAGTAEALPLPDGSVDAVATGEAFHWFDPEPAAREFARVTRPGGIVAVLWNTPLADVRTPWGPELSAMLAAVRPAHPGHDEEDGAHQAAFDAADLFTPLEPRDFANAFTTDRAGLLAHLASLSYVGVLPEPERAELLARADALLREHGVETVDLPLTTRLYTARRREA
ncbi:MAG TPA: class I SAM-dependent methyltransferase [Baekduia sp.]